MRANRLAHAESLTGRPSVSPAGACKSVRHRPCLAIVPMSRSLRSVVAVSGDRQRAELLDALLVDENEYDVIFVESIGGGDAPLKELTPDLGVFCLQTEDAAAWQLPSMLKTDRPSAA